MPLRTGSIQFSHVPSHFQFHFSLLIAYVLEESFSGQCQKIVAIIVIGNNKRMSVLSATVAYKSKNTSNRLIP